MGDMSAAPGGAVAVAPSGSPADEDDVVQASRGGTDHWSGTVPARCFLTPPPDSRCAIYYVPISSHHSVGWLRMNRPIIARHPVRLRLTIRTPRFREYVSGPLNVAFSPITTVGIL